MTSQGIFSGSNKLREKDLREATLPTNAFLTVFVGCNYHTFYGVVQIVMFVRHTEKLSGPKREQVRSPTETKKLERRYLLRFFISYLRDYRSAKKQFALSSFVVDADNRQQREAFCSATHISFPASVSYLFCTTAQQLSSISVSTMLTRYAMIPYMTVKDDAHKRESKSVE